jgi:small subunit ribosomal protein S17e
MGRIRAGFVKRKGEKLIKVYGARFSSNFESNKKTVTELADVPTKKLRNLIAGYVTKKLKSAE